jgi:hypothetical protein
MKRILAIAASAMALPGITLAATRSYDLGPFEAISVAEGVDADIMLGAKQSVTAETRSDNFDDLRISVEGKTLRIDRQPRGLFSQWFSGFRANYKVHVVTPALHSLSASSGADVKVHGSLEGNFSVVASSGSEVHVSELKGGNVSANTSSGSDIDLAGSCASLEATASSGSDLDAEELHCENVTVHTSSGSDVSVTATRRVAGHASSGSDVRVRGRPAQVQVEKSSGADVTVRD